MIVFELREGGLTPSTTYAGSGDGTCGSPVGADGAATGAGRQRRPGGNGGDAYYAGSAGDGGDGGNGGNGGDGGNGGRVHLISATAELERKFELAAPGGIGGMGGQDESRGAQATQVLSRNGKTTVTTTIDRRRAHTGARAISAMSDTMGTMASSTPPVLEVNATEFTDLLDGLPEALKSVVAW